MVFIFQQYRIAKLHKLAYWTDLFRKPRLRGARSRSHGEIFEAVTIGVLSFQAHKLTDRTKLQGPCDPAGCYRCQCSPAVEAPWSDFNFPFWVLFFPSFSFASHFARCTPPVTKPTQRHHMNITAKALILHYVSLASEVCYYYVDIPKHLRTNPFVLCHHNPCKSYPPFVEFTVNEGLTHERGQRTV